MNVCWCCVVLIALAVFWFVLAAAIVIAYLVYNSTPKEDD